MARTRVGESSWDSYYRFEFGFELRLGLGLVLAPDAGTKQSYTFLVGECVTLLLGIQLESQLECSRIAKNLKGGRGKFYTNMPTRC